MMARLVGGVDLSDNGQAMESLLTNGPGQHFLGTPHTMANFERAFWVSSLADADSFEQWKLNGSLNSIKRAHSEWKRLISEYRPPEIDEAVHEELTEWIALRKASFPDSDI